MRSPKLVLAAVCSAAFALALTGCAPGAADPENTSVIAPDPAVAEFVQGGEDGSATFNPGVRALAEGTTTVTMTNQDGGIQPLEFTVEVSAG